MGETADLPRPSVVLGWTLEEEPVLLIQVVAAMLLLLGSGLIFKALVEVDAPTRPSPRIRPRLDRVAAAPAERTSATRLPRAA